MNDPRYESNSRPHTDRTSPHRCDELDQSHVPQKYSDNPSHTYKCSFSSRWSTASPRRITWVHSPSKDVIEGLRPLEDNMRITMIRSSVTHHEGLRNIRFHKWNCADTLQNIGENWISLGILSYPRYIAHRCLDALDVKLIFQRYR